MITHLFILTQLIDSTYRNAGGTGTVIVGSQSETESEKFLSKLFDLQIW